MCIPTLLIALLNNECVSRKKIIVILCFKALSKGKRKWFSGVEVRVAVEKNQA